MKRFLWILAVLVLMFPVTVYAGVMDVLTTLKNAASTGNLITGLFIVILAWVFKAVSNDKIYGFVTAFFSKLGIVCALGLSRYKFTAPLWNKYIEPWLIDFIQNTVGAAVNGFIAGMRSDNPPEG